MSDHEERAVLVITLSQYLTRRAMILAAVNGFSVPFYVIQEAVASTVMAHPEWDLAVLKTWDEWYKELG